MLKLVQWIKNKFMTHDDVLPDERDILHDIVNDQAELVKGLEFALTQLQHKVDELEIIAGALILNAGAGEQEYNIKSEFVEAYTDGGLTVCYGPADNNSIQVWLETVEDTSHEDVCPDWGGVIED